jgi:hypothetical protein
MGEHQIAALNHVEHQGFPLQRLLSVSQDIWVQVAFVGEVGPADPSGLMLPSQSLEFKTGNRAAFLHSTTTLQEIWKLQLFNSFIDRLQSWRCRNYRPGTLFLSYC